MEIKIILKKIRSKAGETIAETLVALLIAALALVMLAGAITSGTSAITRSKKKLDEYYKESESVAQRASGGTGTVTITATGVNLPAYSVNYYKNDEFSKKPVISYKYIKE